MKMTKKASLFVAVLLAAAVTLQAAWTKNRLSFTSVNSYEPSVAALGSYVYAAWYSDGPGNFEIFFRRSLDNGLTWQSTQRLTNALGNSFCPRVAASGTNVYVVWEDSGPGNYEIYFLRSPDNGVTWQSAKRLTNLSGTSVSPAVAVNGANVYVVWKDDTPGNYEIYFRKSTDYGATWQAKQRLTNYAGNSFDPRVAVSGANVYVVWEDETSSNFEIYFRQSTDDGATWQATKRLTNNAGSSRDVEIATGGADVYVVWEDDSPGHYEIYFRKSADYGASWQGKKRLTNNLFWSRQPSLAVSGSNIFVVFAENSEGSAEIGHLKSGDYGATWNASEKITNTTGVSAGPDIAFGDSKRFVVFVDDTSGKYVIFIANSPL